MIRVFQVAKELNIDHTDIMRVLKDEGITVTSHMSTIDETPLAQIASSRGLFCL